MNAVVSIKAARRRRPGPTERLELPSLEDLDSFVAELEEERFFARGRGEWNSVRDVTLIINETLKHRETVVQRSRLRCLVGGRR